MRNFIDKIKDAFEPWRYGNGMQKALYWVCRISVFVIPVGVVLVIAGLIYCKVNGIQLVMPFSGGSAADTTSIQ